MKHKGFIFVMTLITVSVISLLVLGCLNHVLMYYKAINRLENQHHVIYQIEKAALKFANQKSFDRQCLIYGETPDKPLLKLLQQEGCPISLGDIHFHYIIESLGEFPCLTTLNQEGKFSTYHRRLSVLGSPNEDYTVLLQIRFLTPIPLLPCEEAEHSVALGFSSWRFEVFNDLGYNQ